MAKKIIPLYLEVKEKILGMISKGALKVGDKLPPERELSKKLGVSRITVIKALSELAESGFVQRLQGKGTYISNDENKYHGISSAISATAKTKISYLSGTRANEYLLLLELFKNDFCLLNPDIDIEIRTVYPKTAMEDPVMLMLAKGDMPTAGEYFMHSDYSALNALFPLEQLDGFEDLREQLSPKLLYKTKNAAGEHHFHALPSSASSLCAIINHSIAREAGLDPESCPQDLSAMLEWAEILGNYTKKLNGYHGVYCNIPSAWHGVVTYLPFIWGASKSEENTLDDLIHKLKTSDKQWLDNLCQIFKKGNPLLDNNGGYFFALGRVGMMISSLPNVVKHYQLLGAAFPAEAFPIPTSQNNISTGVLGDFSLGIFRAGVKNDAQLKAAWKWIKYLLEPEQQQRISSMLNCGSSRKDIIHPLAGNPQFSAFSDAFKYSRLQYDFRDARIALNIIGREINAALKQEISPETAHANCHNKLVDYLRALSNGSDF
jgi:DNA-binding transcriptional regulator YhcF (GntR family)